MTRNILANEQKDPKRILKIQKKQGRFKSCIKHKNTIRYSYLCLAKEILELHTSGSSLPGEWLSHLLLSYIILLQKHIYFDFIRTHLLGSIDDISVFDDSLSSLWLQILWDSFFMKWSTSSAWNISCFGSFCRPFDFWQYSSLGSQGFLSYSKILASIRVDCWPVQELDEPFLPSRARILSRIFSEVYLLLWAVFSILAKLFASKIPKEL